jgi:hypothetical protein
LNEQERIRKAKFNENKTLDITLSSKEKVTDITEEEAIKETKDSNDSKKVSKSQPELS